MAIPMNQPAPVVSNLQPGMSQNKIPRKKLMFLALSRKTAGDGGEKLGILRRKRKGKVSQFASMRGGEPDGGVRG